MATTEGVKPAIPTPPDPNAKRPRIFFGWYIVGAATINSFLSFGIFTTGLGFFVKDVRDAFGWSATLVTLGFSIKSFETGILAPVGGYMVDRFGPKVMAGVGSILMTTGLLLFSQMDTLFEFFLSAAVIALGQGLGASMAFMTPIMYWFNRKRGTASAFLAMGRGWGYIAATPLAWIIASYGWRQAAVWAAIFYFCCSFPVAFILRKRPEPYGYLPDGVPLPPATADGKKPKVADSESGSFTVKDALRHPAFWCLLAANIAYSFTSQANHVHIANHIRSTGFSVVTAANIVSMYGIVQVIARLIYGPLSDRVGRHRMLIVSYTAMAVGWVAIAFITPGNRWWAVPLYLLFYGLGQGGQAVVSVTMVADFFGPKRFATIRGLMNPMSMVGGIAGPLSAGLIFDHFGSYRLSFLFMSPVILIAAFAMFLAGTPKLAEGSGPKAPAAA